MSFSFCYFYCRVIQTRARLALRLSPPIEIEMGNFLLMCIKSITMGLLALNDESNTSAAGYLRATEMLL